MQRRKTKIIKLKSEVLEIPEGMDLELLSIQFDGLKGEAEKALLLASLLNRNSPSQEYFFAAQTKRSIYELTRYLQHTIAILKRDILLKKTGNESERFFLQLGDLSLRENFLERLEEHTINHYVDEYEAFEKSKSINARLKDQLRDEEVFIGRTEYFRKLDQEKIKNSPLLTSFKLLKTTSERDDYIFNLLNQPIYNIHTCLISQSILDLYQIILHLKASITFKKANDERHPIAEIRKIADDYLDAEMELLSVIKNTFKKRLRISTEFMTIKSNAKRYLKEKYQGLPFQRLKHDLKISLSSSSADKYIDMFKHHLQYKPTTETVSETQGKSELLKDKVIEFAMEYFNADGQVNKDQQRKEREALLVGVCENEIVSFEKMANEQGIQFKVKERDGSQFNFGLTKIRLMKYAMIQHDFKEKNLRAIAEAGEKIENLAAQFMMNEKNKSTLVAHANAYESYIRGCSVSESAGTFHVTVQLADGSDTFALSKSEVEYFAIAEFLAKQQDSSLSNNLQTEKEIYIDKIAQTENELELLACQHLMGQAKDNLARKIDVASHLVIDCSIKKDDQNKFALIITILDHQPIQLDLSKTEMEDLAIAQFKCKQEALLSIEQAALKIEDLAAHHLMNEKKDWLAATSRIHRERIVECSIAKDDSGKFLLKIIFTPQKNKHFMLSKATVEDFAIAQFHLSSQQQKLTN